MPIRSALASAAHGDGVLAQHVVALQHPVPARVRDESRDHDDAGALGDQEAEQQLEQRYGEGDDEELPELDPDVESQERRHEVRAGELQGLPQGEREAEAVHQAEAERHQPAAPHRRPVAGPRGQDVLERHVHDGDRDEGLDQGREPEEVGRHAVRRGDERHGVRHREAGDDRHQRPEAAERDDQAEQEQQVVGAVEDVLVPRGDEAGRSLVPARIERHQAGIAAQLEGPLGPFRGDEAKHGDDAHAQPLDAGPDGEARRLGRDRVVEHYVQHRLAPDDLEAVGEPLADQDVGEGVVVAPERAVGRKRQPQGRDLRFRESDSVLVELHLLRQPELCSVRQQRLRAFEVQVARAPQREVDVLHGLERHADQQAEALSLRLRECLDGHVARDVVRLRVGSETEQQPRRRHEDQRPRPAPALRRLVAPPGAQPLLRESSPCRARDSGPEPGPPRPPNEPPDHSQTMPHDPPSPVGSPPAGSKYTGAFRRRGVSGPRRGAPVERGDHRLGAAGPYLVAGPGRRARGRTCRSPSSSPEGERSG